jgi:anti-sigma factor RsiW
MPCDNYRARLVALLYDDIDASDRADVASHLGSCAVCRESLAALDATRDALREAAPEVPRAPRVLVVGRRGAWSRPGLAFAAGVVGAVLAAGGGAAGYAYGIGRATAVPPTNPEIAAGVVEREVDRRWQALEASLAASRPAQGAAVPPAITKGDLEAALRRLERKIDGSRASDLEYMQNLVTASERRTGGWIGETQKALRYVALANNPALSEQ